MAQISPNPNTGTITVSGSDSNSEIFFNEGIIRILATGTLTNNDSSTLINNGTINNNNNGTLINNDILSHNGILNNNGTLVNNGIFATDRNIFNTQDNNDILNNYGIFNNYGTFTSDFNNFIDFDILNNVGTLNNYGTFTTNYGIFENNGALNNYGTFTTNIGPSTINYGTITNNGTLNNNTSFKNDRILDNNGRFDNNGIFTNTGTLNNIDTFTNTNVISNFSILNNDGTLNNTNTLSNSFTNYDTLNNRKVFNNDGTLNNPGTLNNIDTFTNTGTLNNTSTLSNDGTFNNDGTLNNTGAGSFVNNGTIAGIGRFVGALSGGTVDPGNTADPHTTFTVDGTFTLGTLNISFNGTDAGDFDVLSVTGAANLPSGTINFNFDEAGLKNDIAEGQTESITFLTSGSLSNALNLASLTPTDDADNGADFDFVLRQDGTNLVLDITRKSPNTAPTAVNFDNAVTLLSENVDTSGRIKLADIMVVDDGLGTNNLSLSGPDAASFEISGTTLYLKANTALDFETKPSYSVTVAVDDPTVGSNPDASRTFTLNLVDGADFLPFLVTNTNNSGIGSLRWAVSNANRTAGTETIEFDPSLSGQTIDLSGGALQLTGSTNIDGDIDNDGTADITVDALSSGRVIEVSANQTVTIEGMVLQGGLGDAGGGIFNSGNLTLLNSTVRNNVSLANLGRGGGGIYNNGSNSVLILLNSTVSGNRTNRLGGGIHNDQGQVTIANSRIENNTGNVGGGGFYNFSGFSSLRGIITINDSTIESNSGSLGGGLVNDNGRITLNNSSLLNNTAGDTRSGAIFNQDDVLGEGAVVTLNGSVVSGGVYGNTINNGARGLLVINGTVSGETLQGSQGVDQISGLEGDDLLQGFQGSDTLIGGDGNDVVNGGDSNDLLQGGAGNDRLGGLGGTDRMEGGTGNDVYTVNNAAATLVEGVGEGNDTVRSEISWSLGSNFENLTLLGTGNLNGTGNAINNTLTGNSGANSLEGQGGNDRLIGNGGDDVLIGGAGADTVTGGGGNDRFVFNAISDGGDRITDFTANSDRIGVSAAGFGAGLNSGALLASQFAIGSLTTTDQRFLYDTSTGALFFDSNGSTAGGRTRIATLTTKPILSASDILITT